CSPWAGSPLVPRLSRLGRAAFPPHRLSPCFFLSVILLFCRELTRSGQYCYVAVGSYLAKAACSRWRIFHELNQDDPMVCLLTHWCCHSGHCVELQRQYHPNQSDFHQPAGPANPRE